METLLSGPTFITFTCINFFAQLRSKWVSSWNTFGEKYQVGADSLAGTSVYPLRTRLASPPHQGGSSEHSAPQNTAASTNTKHISTPANIKHMQHKLTQNTLKHLHNTQNMFFSKISAKTNYMHTCDWLYPNKRMSCSRCSCCQFCNLCKKTKFWISNIETRSIIVL